MFQYSIIIKGVRQPFSTNVEVLKPTDLFVHAKYFYHMGGKSIMNIFYPSNKVDNLVFFVKYWNTANRYFRRMYVAEIIFLFNCLYLGIYFIKTLQVDSLIILIQGNKVSIIYCKAERGKNKKECSRYVFTWYINIQNYEMNINWFAPQMKRTDC